MKVSGKILGENYPEMSKRDIANILGFIPGWLNNHVFFEYDAKEALEKQYGFGPLHDNDKTTIDKNGIWLFPDDPPLKPLCKMFRGKETIYQYLYGLVAIIDENGNSFCTRMD